jgi:hypothetical protein
MDKRSLTILMRLVLFSSLRGSSSYGRWSQTNRIVHVFPLGAARFIGLAFFYVSGLLHTGSRHHGNATAASLL